MEELFLSFWNRSVSAGWLILAVIALRLALRKAPKSFRCLLWLLVGFRLVCPFSIQSAASLLPSAEMIPQTVLTEPPPQIHTGIAALNSHINDQLAQGYTEYAEAVPEAPADPASPADPVVQTRSIARLCAGAWLLGMAVMMLWALAGWLKLRRRVAEAVPEGDGIWLCERIGSPFLLGIFRPRIYLPPNLDADSRTYVLAHERAHIKRGDHLTKPAGFLLLSVYWFQPLVWLAYVLLCRDIELACDERVIRELGMDCKKPYSQALLRCSSKRGGTAVCPLAFGEVGVKERVKNVLNYRKPTFWVAAASLAVCVIAAVCFLTDPADKPVKSGAEPVAMSQTVSNAPSTAEGLDSTDLPPIGQCSMCMTYAGGALMYQPAAYSSYSPGWHPAIRDYADDTLTVTEQDGTVSRYRLLKEASYTREEFYSLYADLQGQEAMLGTALMPQDAEAIRRYIYQAAEADAAGEFPTLSIWKWQEHRKYRVVPQCWVDFNGRLFDLIANPDWWGPFCYDYCVLWDYDPRVSTTIPIRFDLDGPIFITAKTGTLFTSVNGQLQETQAALLEIEPEETIYWKPFSDGEPANKANLLYQYGLDGGGAAQDTLELNDLTDYTGLYGSKTYGISNNWFNSKEASRVHYSAVETDPETGALLVSRHEGTIPYELQDPEDFPTEKPQLPPLQITDIIS